MIEAKIPQAISFPKVLVTVLIKDFVTFISLELVHISISLRHNKSPSISILIFIVHYIIKFTKRYTRKQDWIYLTPKIEIDIIGLVRK